MLRSGASQACRACRAGDLLSHELSYGGEISRGSASAAAEAGAGAEARTHEATAMATAAHVKREVDELLEAVGKFLTRAFQKEQIEDAACGNGRAGSPK
mmetsp:Transcript_30587/g.66986  ORF Transcript_30587/g.66986 Transcript_30587/m.66986 type:complete len:99 (+) Transcript_30587:1085-1381(+)